MLRITKRTSYTGSQFQRKILLSPIPHQPSAIPSDASWAEHHEYTFWTTLYRRVPDVSLCSAPPYHSIGWTSQSPSNQQQHWAWGSAAEGRSPLSPNEEPLSPSPIGIHIAGPQEPLRKMGWGLSYMENSSEDLGKENK